MSDLECGACGAQTRDTYLCNRDTDQLRTDLLLAALAVTSLRISYTRQDINPTERIGKPMKAKYTPLPWNEAARGVLDDLTDLMRKHAFLTRIIGHDEAPETIARALAYATGTIRLNPAAGALAKALTDILKRTEAATDRRESMWNYGPCTTCGTPLDAPVEAKRVTCPQCNTGYDADKLRTDQWGTRNATLVTQAEAAQLLHIRVKTSQLGARKAINKWVERGLIELKASGYVLFGDVYSKWTAGEKDRQHKAARKPAPSKAA